MYQRNLFLIQLELANTLANSSWPQEKRLALILLENLLEISLKRKVESEIIYDNVTWDKGRSVPSKQRHKILRYHEELLRFCLKKNFIDEEEKAILQFVHDIRNETYHGTRSIDHDKVELGISLCCNMLRDDPIRWISKGGMYVWSIQKGYENRYFKNLVPIGQNVDKEIEELVPKLLSYGANKKNSVNVQLANLLGKEFQTIRHNLASLREAIPEINFNNVFRANAFISNIQITDLTKAPIQIQLELILAYHECVALLKEELSDLQDIQERYKRFAELLKTKIKTRPKYPFEVVKRFNKKSLNFSKISTAEALAKMNSILHTIEPLSISSEEAAGALSDYIQHQYDLYRGK